MKYIREASDLHLDFDIGAYNGSRVKQVSQAMDMLWMPSPMDGDLDTTFIIAGDIWTEGRFANRKWEGTNDTWIARIARQFKYVVLVLGNHDYWGSNVEFEAYSVMQSLEAQGLTNVHLLEQSTVVLDQVKFVGGTLWTDYNRNDPLVMHDALNRMMDYKYIRWGSHYRKFLPRDAYDIFRKTKRFIFQNAQPDDANQKVVVVTHMAPSFRSVSEKYHNAYSVADNYYYYSDIEEQIRTEGRDIRYWFHGHMHHAAEYMIGTTKVVLNARGYLTEDTGFDQNWRVAV